MAADPMEKLEADEVERITLDLSVSEVGFVERYAAFRNAMNDLQGRRKRRWTRKGTFEALISAQVELIREQLGDVFAELGDLPEGEEEIRAYAKKVLARSDKKR